MPCHPIGYRLFGRQAKMSPADRLGGACERRVSPGGRAASRGICTYGRVCAELLRPGRLSGLEKMADQRSVLSREAMNGAGQLKELTATEPADLLVRIEGYG